MGQSSDSIPYPSVHASDGASRRLLATSATVGVVATAGCAGNESSGDAAQQSTVFVFDTGDGTASLLDPERDELVETRAVDLSSSFPSNQYTAELTDDSEDSLWLNVGNGVRGLSVGSLSETASIETDSGANWLERTSDGNHVVVSAREPSHRQLRLEADPASATFDEVTAEVDRIPEGGRGDRDGPSPCDVTIHPGRRVRVRARHRR